MDLTDDTKCKHLFISEPQESNTAFNLGNQTLKLYDFEVRRARDIGGYWATCKELHANTQAPNMKELEKSIIECANLMFEVLTDGVKSSFANIR